MFGGTDLLGASEVCSTLLKDDLVVEPCQSDLGTPGFGDPYPRIPSDMGARSPMLVILGLPGGPTALEVWGPCVVT